MNAKDFSYLNLTNTGLATFVHSQYSKSLLRVQFLRVWVCSSFAILATPYTNDATNHIPMRACFTHDVFDSTPFGKIHVRNSVHVGVIQLMPDKSSSKGMMYVLLASNVFKILGTVIELVAIFVIDVEAHGAHSKVSTSYKMVCIGSALPLAFGRQANSPIAMLRYVSFEHPK